MYMLIITVCPFVPWGNQTFAPRSFVLSTKRKSVFNNQTHKLDDTRNFQTEWPVFYDSASQRLFLSDCTVKNCETMRLKLKRIFIQNLVYLICLQNSGLGIGRLGTFQLMVYVGRCQFVPNGFKNAEIETSRYSKWMKPVCTGYIFTTSSRLLSDSKWVINPKVQY
jgi:hypothetical protein